MSSELSSNHCFVANVSAVSMDASASQRVQSFRHPTDLCVFGEPDAGHGPRACQHGQVQFRLLHSTAQEMVLVNKSIRQS